MLTGVICTCTVLAVEPLESATMKNRVYFVKAKDAFGSVVCAGHWLAPDTWTARSEFEQDAKRTNSHPDVIAAGLSRNMDGLEWTATASKTKPQNAMNCR